MSDRFPAEAGTRLPTTEGWKAEWTQLAGYTEVVYRSCLETVTHLSTNRARRRLTWLIRPTQLIPVRRSKGSS